MKDPVNVESSINNIFVRNILKFTRLGKTLSAPFLSNILQVWGKSFKNRISKEIPSRTTESRKRTLIFLQIGTDTFCGPTYTIHFELWHDRWYCTHCENLSNVITKENYGFSCEGLIILKLQHYNVSGLGTRSLNIMIQLLSILFNRNTFCKRFHYHKLRIEIFICTRYLAGKSLTQSRRMMSLLGKDYFWNQTQIICVKKVKLPVSI